ncbi:MAG: hypothetical protein GY953_23065 [bacterium]|nr:hypothetical protein [bacterium]
MAGKKKRKHDPVYRRIFNRAQIMEEILKRHATGPWAAHLDFSTLEPVPADFIAKYLKTLEEVRMSLLQRAEKWTQQWMAEGEAKGKRLGMAETLKNQAQRRFGDLPDWAVDRIDRADVDTLELWSYRVLDAAVLEDVFQDGEPSQE